MAQINVAGRTYTYMLPSTAFTASPTPPVVVPRKPVAFSDGGVRIVTPSTNVKTRSCHHVALPLSPVSSDDDASSGQEEKAYLQQHLPPRLPVQSFPSPTIISMPTLSQFPEHARQRQRSDPDSREKAHVHKEAKAHTRHLSFDPGLVSSGTHRHPHEHGKTTGFRRRGASLRLVPVACLGREAAAKQPSQATDTVVQHGLVTPPPSAHEMQGPEDAEMPLTRFHPHENGSSGPPVPPKDPPKTEPSGANTQKTSSPTRHAVDTGTNHPPRQYIDHTSFFDDDDEDLRGMQVLRRMMSNFRTSQGSSGGEAEKSFQRPRSAMLKKKIGVKRRFVRRLREFVLCARSEERR